jgi:predicted transcriptional regulator
MSPHHDPTNSERKTESPEPIELLSLLDDEHTLALLQAIQTEAKSARALSEECDASRPTIYRRLNSLEEFGLVRSEWSFDADGHHRTMYESTLETVTVDIEDDGFSAQVATSEPPHSRQTPTPGISGD